MFIRIVRLARLWAFLACLGASAELSLGQEKPIRLRVQIEDVDITKITAPIARDEGIFKKNGLDVEVFIWPATAAGAKRRGVIVPAQSIRSGDSQIQLGGGVPMIYDMTHSASSARDRVILATVDPLMHWHIMAQPELNKLEDLKGKRLGLGSWGAMHEYEARVVAEKMGWDPRFDLSLMIHGSDMDSLKSRAVDAVIASMLMQARATAAGYHDIFDLRTWQAPIAGSGINSTRSWVKANPEATRRFAKSIVEAMALMKKDKKVAFRAMARWYGFDKHAMEVSYEGEMMAQKPYPSVEGVKKTMQIFDSHEMRKYKAEDFYDDSFIRELDQSGFIDSLYR